MPNDGMCHIAESNKYDHLQDYPTVAQISRKIAENSINVIFAVPAAMVPTYRALHERVQGSYVGVLSEDSSNIVELVKKTYATVIQSQSLSFSVQSNRYFFTVSIRTGNQFFDRTAPPNFWIC